MQTQQHSRLNSTKDHYFHWRLTFTIVNLHSQEGWKNCQTDQAWLIYISKNTVSSITLCEYTWICIQIYSKTIILQTSFQIQWLSPRWHFPEQNQFYWNTMRIFCCTMNTQHASVGKSSHKIIVYAWPIK